MSRIIKSFSLDKLFVLVRLSWPPFATTSTTSLIPGNNFSQQKQSSRNNSAHNLILICWRLLQLLLLFDYISPPHPHPPSPHEWRDYGAWQMSARMHPTSAGVESRRSRPLLNISNGTERIFFFYFCLTQTYHTIAVGDTRHSVR